MKAIATIFLFALLFSVGAARAQQTGTIAGTVIDSLSGEPLPGVNVVIAGTQQGASTDANGDYAMTSVEPDTYDLLASFVGYATKRIEGVEVASGETATVNIALSPTRLGLEEVVVVGYGTQERADLTGAVSTMSAEDIEQAPVSSIAQALEGKVAGVRISGGWNPSAGSTIRIRGTRSISAGNDPLIVLNGVPSSIPLHDINPSNIASVNVLKGTSATAIYGSRGANGVILITTKGGTPGETQVSYNAYVGMQQPYDRLDMMNAEEYVAMVEEAFADGGQPDLPLSEMFNAAELAGIEAGTDTNWQDFVFRTGIQQDHTLSISGGTERTQFRISPSVYSSTGVLEEEFYRRYSLLTDVSHQFSDRFRAHVSVIATRGKSSDGPGGLLFGSTYMVPVVGPYDDEGNPMLFPNNDITVSNPVTNAQNVTTETITNSVSGVLSAQYAFSPALSYQVQFGPEVRFESDGEFRGSQTGANQGGDPTALQDENRLFHYTWNNIVRYDQRFADRHDVELTLAYTLEQQNETGFNADVRGLPYNSLYHNLGSAREISGVGSYLTEWTLQSFVGRINYILNDKYLLTLTAREDGSSRLAEGNKWSFFPSAALAWRISNEAFMESASDVVSNLKLRVGYGQSGNTAIDPYQTLGGLGRVSYWLGSEAAYGYYPAALANPNLGWETTTQLNVGLDFGLWQNRVTGSVNYYRQHTSNLLLTKQLPTSTGFSDVLTNIGETKNIGLGLSLSTINIATEDFQWSTDLNVSTNHNEIVKLYGTGQDDVANAWFLGEPIDVYYDYAFGGIWQKDEAEEAAAYGWVPGIIRPVDQNNDGGIDAEDRVILGSPFPNWTAGLTSTLSYKNIDFSFVINTVQGNMLFNQMRMYLTRLGERYNSLDVNYWTPSNPSNEWPRPSTLYEGPPFRDLLGYIDGSYVRIKRITLAYTLPSAFTQRFGAESWRLYVTAQNPYVFASDKFVGFDPQNAAHMDESPSYRTFLFGVDLRF